jgi:hypothetical protein
VLTRDIALFVSGLVVMFLEIRRPEIRDGALILVGILFGSPIGAAGLSSLAEAVTSRGGTGPSSSSPPAAGQPPSGSPSSSGT